MHFTRSEPINRVAGWATTPLVPDAERLQPDHAACEAASHGRLGHGVLAGWLRGCVPSTVVGAV